MKNADSLLNAEVHFYDNVSDSKLKFAVIISKSDSKWVLCKHWGRNDLEIPGGMREDGETIVETARRELYEETGAIQFDIEKQFVYSTKSSNHYNGEEAFGMVFFAQIYKFETNLHFEIEKVLFLDSFPENMAYSSVQPEILKEFFRRKKQLHDGY